MNLIRTLAIVWLVAASGSVAALSIDAVRFVFEGDSPVLLVSGSGFGTQPAIGQPPPPPNTGVNYGNQLHFRTTAAHPFVFSAGYSNESEGRLDHVGLVVDYADRLIRIRFGSFYLSHRYELRNGDPFVLVVKGVKYTGHVAFDCERPPKRGDVVVFRKPDETGTWTVAHTAVVSAVDRCRVLLVTSKEDWYGPIRTRPPDDLAAWYGSWTVYTTDRVATRCGNNPLTCEATEDDPNKLLNAGDLVNRTIDHWTDRGRTVRVISIGAAYYDAQFGAYQCHGFTFGGQDRAVVDVHASAVRVILNDNGYRQVRALGPDGKPRFDPRFEPR